MMKKGQAVKLRAYDDVIKDKDCADFVDDEDIYGMWADTWESIRAGTNTFVKHTDESGIVIINSSYLGYWYVPKKCLE